MAATVNDTSANWRTKAVEWIFSQGVSTILLLMILIGGYQVATYAFGVAVPAHLKQIQEGYERIEKSHDSRVRELIKTFENERTVERQHYENATSAVRELVQELRQGSGKDR